MSSNNLITGGILAIFLVILQAFIPIGLHDLYSYIVLISLAIAAPCLTACIIINTHVSKYPYTQSAVIVNTIYGAGVFSGFIGVAATFWYISWIVGVVFLMVSLVVFALSLVYVNQLSQDEQGLHMWK